MSHLASRPAIAFEGLRCIAAGRLAEVAAQVRPVLDQPDAGAVLVFDANSSELIDLDWRGSVAAVVKRLLPDPPSEADSDDNDAAALAPRGRGRPRLGVVAREVTLLPRHWEWLAMQPGGASVALRKLVEEARRVNADRDKARVSRDSAYRFMSGIASALAGFEEASRQLFAGSQAGLDEQMRSWPHDVRTHVLALAQDWFAQGGAEPAAPRT